MSVSLTERDHRVRLAKSNGDVFEGNAGGFGGPAFARLSGIEKVNVPA
jgi:hypothetical protein